jgi:hypothetical protein
MAAYRVFRTQRTQKAHERDSNVYNNQKIRSNLQMLTETAKNKVLRQEMELLRNINRTLQDQASLQIEKKNIHCLWELCVVDPKIEMREIEDRKDSLLQDSYKWLGHPTTYSPIDRPKRKSFNLLAIRLCGQLLSGVPAANC